MNVNIYRGDLEACRVCLATDIKLISLQDNHLQHIYSEFSGVPMMVFDSLPQHICVYCCHLLKKCFKFKQKCKDTNNMLRRYLLEIHALTTSFINTLDRSHLRIPLNITETLECHCIPESYIKTEVTDENAIKTETISTSDEYPECLDCLDNNSNKECDAGVENNESEPEHEESKLLEEVSEAANTGSGEKQEQKDNLNPADKILNDNEDRVEDFKTTYLNKVMHSDKELFYLFILEKYVKKGKSVEYNDLSISYNKSDVKAEISALISTDNYDIEYSREDVKNSIELFSSTQNIHLKRYYEFINHRYVNNSNIMSTIRQNKVTDIDKMNKTYVPRKGTITKDSLAKLSKECNFDVKVLLKEEKLQDFLKRKEHENYKNCKYKCELCYTGFASEKTFQNHKAVHDPSAGAFECTLCQVRFKSASRQRTHLMLHTYKFICRECGRILRNTSQARNHHRTHSGLKYTCEHCNQTFNTYKARLTHIQFRHGSVSCDICQKKFSSQIGLATHKTKAHRELFKCAMCLVLFHNGNALQRHQELTVKTSCGAHIKACTVCGESLFDEASLGQHMRKNHHTWRRDRSPLPQTCLPKQKKVPRSNATQLMCEICAKTFQFPALLKYHQSTQHSDDRPFACQQCDKRYKHKSLLKEHMKTHTEERRFQCAHCEWSFRVRWQLVTHLRVHSDERPFPCPICQKRFKARDTVQFHVRTVHEGQPTKKRVRKRKPAGNNKQ